jgi:hypothetical protein
MIARFAIPFFFFMGLVVVPLVLTLLCRWLLPRRYFRKAALACTIIIWALVLYGHFVGYRQLVVRQVEYVSADLPEAFDGYRIVHFSDAHIATMTGYNEGLCQRAIDSINAQGGDMIVFTGDMQNVYPDELSPRASVFRQLHAKDGVYAVLGNHDYAVYQPCDSVEKERHCEQTVAAIRQMGFMLLQNENRIIRRDSDSIVVAGMENWGKAKRMPRKGDVKKTLEGLNCQQSSSNTHQPFIVMLQHDPTCWREKILPECHAQLTLSGHTHGGQFSLFGWSPVALNYDEWESMTYEGKRAIYVSAGLGALIPFRLNQPGEIVVITLKKDKQ